MATNVLGLMDYVQQQGEKGRERGTQSRLASLASQAYGAQGEQRNALVGQAIATDPNAGFALGDKLQQREDNRSQKFAGAAKYMLGAVESNNPAQVQGAWRTVRPFLEELVGPSGKVVPEQWTDDMLPALHQAIAAGQGAGGGQEMKSLRIGGNGNYWAIQNGQFVDTGVPADARTQLRDQPGIDPGLVNLRTGQVSPLQTGAPQPQQMAPGEVPFTIDPNLPPQVQAAIRANPEAGSAQGIASLQVGQQPQQSGGGGLTQARPAPASAAPVVQLNSDEIAALGLPAGTVAQRNTGTGAVDIVSKPAASAANKPMPVSALRLLQDSREKLSIAGGNIQSLANIGQQLASGQIDLGFIANTVSRARNFSGASTPESRNFALMMSSLEKLRNDSLRLNNGVQTEGDAQRAWNELMNNLNDEEVVSAQIVRIIELNKRAERLHQENMDEITANYGAGQQASPEQEAADNIESLLEMYN